MTIAEKVAVNTRYTRSTNVERDRGSRSITEAYLPTTGGLALLDEIRRVFDPADIPRAWSLTGPYGSGKSSFALFLHELLGAGLEKKVAVDVLSKERADLAACFGECEPWCRVVLTGSEEPMPRRLLVALDEAASAFWAGRPGRNPGIVAEIRLARETGEVTPSRLLALIQGLQLALETARAGGLVIIIDELGKFLEYEVRQGGSGMFLLQQLAEQAFRGRAANLLLFVLLHQGFDVYARGMGQKLKNDWTKVQGRFENVSFVEPPEQSFRILAAAFSNSLSTAEARAVATRSRSTARALGAAKCLPTALDLDAAADLFAACYPLHPLALLALPALCQRFAQNERTMFSYLGSREPHGFQDSIKSLSKVGDSVGLPEIYDYFVHNQPAVLSDPLTHRRWAEVATAVERAENAAELREANEATHRPVALAKAIGVLNLISRSDGLKASRAVLRRLFASERAFRQTLQPLLDASVVQYRRFNDEYRLWQGTDFDIDERFALERDKIGRFDLAATLCERAPSEPVIARRHSIETGSLRYFDVTFVDAQSPRAAACDSTPRIVFFLAESRDDAAAFDFFRQAATPTEIWVLHRQGSAIRAAIADVLALEAIQRNSQELGADPVAAREVKERLRAARVSERAAINALIGEPARSMWYRGDRQLGAGQGRSLQRALSDTMDTIYGKSPLLRSELANRDRLSSQAAAARNRLFQHMLEHAAESGLGIEKYPPERAIYRSVLEAGRLHTEGPSGWALSAPSDQDDPLNLRPTWQRLHTLLEESAAAPVSVARLMEDLAGAPYGVKRGIFPILFLHYYLLHRDEIAVYDDGTYTPGLRYEHLERLVRRPDLFSLQRFRVEGQRAALFDEYSKALFGEVRDALSVLDLARPLSAFMLSLDDYAKKTRRLSPITLKVREAFFMSKSPQKLLFEALPCACDADSGDSASELGETLIGALRELKNAQATLLDDMRSALCRAFSLPAETTIGELRELLRGTCHGLEQYTIDMEGMKGLLHRLANRELADDEWFANILLFLARKSAAKWSDQDRDTAEYRLTEFTARLLDLQALDLHAKKSSRRVSSREVVLVKAVSSVDGEGDGVICLTEPMDAAIKDARSRIEAILAETEDGDFKLALVASLASRFLIGRRDQQQQRRTEHAIRRAS